MSIPKRYSDDPITKKLYSTWRGIKTRCYNPNFHAYKYYGGKGVKLCDAWHDFEVFKEWAIENGYEIGLTFDRINNDADYEPCNIQFITQSEQCRKSCPGRLITHNGETHNITEWAKLYNISANSLRNSLDAGKSFEEAVVYHREHFVTLSGETHSVTEWAKITGIPRGTLSNRLRSGKTPEEVLRKVDYRGKLV